MCPPGATSAIVFSQPVGSDPGDAYEDKFDCADIHNTVADLPTGEYDVYVRLKDTAENTTFAESGSTRVNITDGGLASVDAKMYVDQGFYALDWTLTGNGAPATCAQVAGENGVSIVATVSGGSTFVDTVRDCEDGGDGIVSYTDPMPLTEVGYTVVASLLNAQDESIGDSQAIVGPQLIVGNQAFDIGTADIVLR